MTQATSSLAAVTATFPKLCDRSARAEDPHTSTAALLRGRVNFPACATGMRCARAGGAIGYVRLQHRNNRPRSQFARHFGRSSAADGLRVRLANLESRTSANSLGRLRGSRVDHKITRCDGGQRRTDRAYEPEGKVEMRKRRARGHDVAGSNDHAPIIAKDFRIARSEKWS